MRRNDLLVFLTISTTTWTIVFAQLSSMRATIPGSLHQCEETTIFFFDSDNVRPLKLALLPSNPPLARSSPRSRSTMTWDEAINEFGPPLQVVEAIETLDTEPHEWTVKIPKGETFDTWAFLPDGNGKNLNLTRTVSNALPTRNTDDEDADNDNSNSTSSSNNSRNNNKRRTSCLDPPSKTKRATSGVIYVGKALEASPPGRNTSRILVGAPSTTLMASTKTTTTTAAAVSVAGNSVVQVGLPPASTLSATGSPPAGGHVAAAAAAAAAAPAASTTTADGSASGQEGESDGGASTTTTTTTTTTTEEAEGGGGGNVSTAAQNSTTTTTTTSEEDATKSNATSMSAALVPKWSSLLAVFTSLACIGTTMII